MGKQIAGGGRIVRRQRSSFATKQRRTSNTSAKRPGLPPFERGQTITVKIEETGSKGDGIAYKDGFTIIIPNTNLGERVKAKVFRIQKTIVRAQRVDAKLAPGRGVIKRVSRRSK